MMYLHFWLQCFSPKMFTVRFPVSTARGEFVPGRELQPEAAGTAQHWQRHCLVIFPKVIFWQLSAPSLLVFPLIYILQVYFIDKAANTQIKIYSLMMRWDICVDYQPIPVQSSVLLEVSTNFKNSKCMDGQHNLHFISVFYIIPCIVSSLLDAHLTISRHVHQLLSYRLTVCHIIMTVFQVGRVFFFCLQLNTNSFFLHFSNQIFLPLFLFPPYTHLRMQPF